MKNLPDIQMILRWSENHSYGMLLGAAIFFTTGHIIFLLSLGFLSFLYFLYQHRAYLQTLQPLGGYANQLTFMRLVIICIAGLNYQNWANEWLFLCFGLAVLLDVFDGYLARKFNQSSDLGLYFDMETDAFFVALVASILYSKGMMDAWLLLPAYMRYLYMILLKVLPIKVKKEPKRKYASFIAGCFFVTLVAPFWLSASFYTWPLRFSGGLIMLSFSISLVYQLFPFVAEPIDKKTVAVHKGNP